MRISDWSSDVCSSDLGDPGFQSLPDVAEEVRLISGASVFVLIYPIWFGTPPAMLKGYVERVLGTGFSYRDVSENQEKALLTGAHLLSFTSTGNTKTWLNEQAQWLARSEEHTTEVQSIMRITYAVYCLQDHITLT